MLLRVVLLLPLASDVRHGRWLPVGVATGTGLGIVAGDDDGDQSDLDGYIGVAEEEGDADSYCCCSGFLRLLHTGTGH